MRKRWWVLIILVCIIAISFVGIQFKINHLKAGLRDYLVNQRNISASDIVSIDTKIGKLPTFPMYVTFRDEPDKTYTYTDRGVGQWVQIFPNEDVIQRGGQFKHWEGTHE
ncbi:DUF3139 domain-containing protein [Paenibacillus campi]|uniref:DUF3139 domain-containing protein n=1 Tax=Paenibacillus campi TaxID=3106031 RepID=UPI002AFF11A7|nr:DUF3139 domain-containing protein [Paenibacillus sp. SGZ-1014]